ncbi:MAG TPA: hypothetical protein VFT64_09860 [Rickettsiales bacterium]|nr:hypothetical protein [Rickettsiales bacterium]
MTKKNALAITLLLLLLSACARPYADLRSPCVGIEGSPCARHPVNDWWMKDKQDS